jgi:hypothetical protein
MKMAMKKRRRKNFSENLKASTTRESEKRLIQVVRRMIENYSNDFSLSFNTINVHGLIKQFGFHDSVCVCVFLILFSFSSSRFLVHEVAEDFN